MTKLPAGAETPKTRMEWIAEQMAENGMVTQAWEVLEMEKDAKRYRRIRENWLDCDELNLHGRLSVIDNRIDAALGSEAP